MSEEVVYLKMYAHHVEHLAKESTSSAYFYSDAPWTKVKKVLDRLGHLRVLIRPTLPPNDYYCHYVADLIDVKLAKFDVEVNTEEARKRFVETHFQFQRQVSEMNNRWPEDLKVFSNGKTFYRLSNAQRIRPIKMDLLIKENGKPLSTGFKYGRPSLCRTDITIETVVQPAIISSYDADREPLIGDAREVALRSIRLRRGQQEFREALLNQNDRCCAVTGCSLSDVLEAAHIRPYRGHAEDNNVGNGLLLRSDIHVLFDVHLLTIHPETLLIEIDETIRTGEYGSFHGQTLKCPLHPERRRFLRDRVTYFSQEK